MSSSTVLAQRLHRRGRQDVVLKRALIAETAHRPVSPCGIGAVGRGVHHVGCLCHVVVSPPVSVSQRNKKGAGGNLLWGSRGKQGEMVETKQKQRQKGGEISAVTARCPRPRLQVRRRRDAGR